MNNVQVKKTTLNRKKMLRFCFLIVFFLLILIIHASSYIPFIADDALISLRYAKRLINGSGLTWTEGKPVEGYSNLLWILVTALGGYLGLDLIVSARLFGFIFMAIALLALCYSHSKNNISKILSLITGSLAFVLAGPVAVWTIGGLEQPLVVALFSWAVVLCYPILEKEKISFKLVAMPSFCLGLLSITRPDGVLFTVSIIFSLLLFSPVQKERKKLIYFFLIFPAIFYFGQLIFRLSYYGEWIPNTALVKLTPSIKHFLGGINYVKRGFFSLTPFSWIALGVVLFGLFNKAKPPRIGFLCTIILIWLTYVSIIGGDIFPAYRHFVPVILVMSLLLREGIYWLMQNIKFSWAIVLVTLVLTGLFLWYSHNQFHNPQNQRAKTERWEWEGKVIGTMLKKGFNGLNPTLATTVAGCLPYWSEFPAIDMLGLNDYHIPRNPPKNLGQGHLGHELGDGKYVLKKNPDLIIFTTPRGHYRGFYLSERQLEQDPLFFKRYTITKFQYNNPYKVLSRIWINRYSPKIGVQITDKTISIPSYLINGNPKSIIYLNPQNDFFVLVSPRNSPYIDLTLSPGKWQVDVEASFKPLVVVKKTGSILFKGQLPTTVELVGLESVALKIIFEAPKGKNVQVKKLIFTRV